MDAQEDVQALPPLVKLKAKLLLVYRDADGNESNREVEVFGYDPDSDTLEAFCLLRKANRSFRLDRIVRAVDRETGEDIPPDDLRARFLGRYAPSSHQAAPIEPAQIERFIRSLSPMSSLCLGAVLFFRGGFSLLMRFLELLFLAVVIFAVGAVLIGLWNSTTSTGSASPKEASQPVAELVRSAATGDAASSSPLKEMPKEDLIGGASDDLRHWMYLEPPPFRGLSYQIASLGDYRAKIGGRQSSPSLKVVRWLDHGEWRYVAGFDLGRQASRESDDLACLPSCQLMVKIDDGARQSLMAFQYSDENPYLGGAGQAWLVDPTPLLSGINDARSVEVELPAKGRTYQAVFVVKGLTWNIAAGSVVVAKENSSAPSASAPEAASRPGS
ncbi:WYL domain-containing protein [Chromobacterium amazonense]|nr:WYL domain-containing protein [Chromobacterium amazonense]